MGKLNLANLKKTSYYLKRNGLKKTFHAVLERLDERKQPPYVFAEPDPAKLAAQRAAAGSFATTFSILVPAYRTRKEHLCEMIGSLQAQTYPKWELVLADATEDDSVEKIVRTIVDDRIQYIRLEKNAGIAENTNQGLRYAKGDYVGLLDHDDLLTPDALYEMAAALEQSSRQGVELQLLYSDEDKCNQDATEYYEPNFKEKFNLDLLLSNNYICHFLVMKRELIQKLGFRSEYDGAQDYDLVLRAVGTLLSYKSPDSSATDKAPADFVAARQEHSCIHHIPKVLYHWRCHTGSTAQNPQSKLYAYEAGRRAIADFAAARGWRAEVRHTPHLGFYALEYLEDIFATRPDIGAVGGRVTEKKRVLSGRLSAEGEVFYQGLPVYYSGYLHRSDLSQDAEAVDIRNIALRQECHKIFKEITGVTYKAFDGTNRFDTRVLPKDCDYIALSVALGRALRQEGWRILYLP